MQRKPLMCVNKQLCMDHWFNPESSH